MPTIKILGSRCANCKRLEQLVTKVLNEFAMETDIIKVTDPTLYADYGVLATPALVINEHTVCSGRVPSLVEIERLVESAQATT